MSKTINYINGAFLKKVYDKNDSLLIGVGIKKDEFIANLQALPADDRGFINLTIGTQKKDKNRYSIWVDDYERKSSSGQPGYKPAPKTSSAYSDTAQGFSLYPLQPGSGPVIDDSDLPF